MLTILLPTRNRPRHCVSQLRFLRDSGLDCPINVLDGSHPDAAGIVHAACVDVAEYRHFDPTWRLVDKLAEAIIQVATPYVILVPDDDVILPHAVSAGLAFLQDNADYAVAHGYFLAFGMENEDVDIYDVIGFTPSIRDDEPLARHYRLFSRYQSFYWGVFRTQVFAAAVTAARAMNVVLFRELTVMSTSVLQGKVMRLPLVHALRSPAPSNAALHQSHPLFWVLRDAESFFDDYVVYRNALARFVRDRGIAVPPAARLEQLLDLSHATWLGREVDVAMFNHAARVLLGEDVAPIGVETAWTGVRQPAPGDVVHASVRRRRQYVWRRNVLAAEPQDEITIGDEEMARVERQLDAYSLDDADQEVG